MTARITNRAWARLEERLARAMIAKDPVAAFEAAARDALLHPELRVRIAAADRDGVAIIANLIAAQRLERLLRGSDEARRLHARNPDGFEKQFRRYHAHVLPTAFFAEEEAALFAAWRTRAERRKPRFKKKLKVVRASRGRGSRP